MWLNDLGKCITAWSIIVSGIASGNWQINLTLPYREANDVPSLYPFTIFVFSGYLVKVMNID
jgi:hypothetical protein